MKGTAKCPVLCSNLLTTAECKQTMFGWRCFHREELIQMQHSYISKRPSKVRETTKFWLGKKNSSATHSCSGFSKAMKDGRSGMLRCVLCFPIDPTLLRCLCFKAMVMFTAFSLYEGLLAGLFKHCGWEFTANVLVRRQETGVFILSKECDMVTFIFLSITSVVGKSLNISDLSRDSEKKAIFKEPELGTFPQPFLSLQKSRFVLPPPQSSLNPCSSTLLLSVSAKWWCSTRSWHGWKPRVLPNVCPIDFVNVTS